MTLGGQLHAHRRTLGYTVPHMCALLGISEEHLRRLERDTWPSAPSPALRDRLAVLLGGDHVAPRRHSLPRSPALLPAPTTLGARLLRRRLQLGLTQRALGTRVRIHVTAVSRFEHDRARPSARMLGYLAEGLECRVDELQEAPEQGVRQHA